MVFSPNLLIQVCVMMYSLLVMCTLFFGCVERKLNIPLNTNKFFTHTVSLRALCPPPLCLRLSGLLLCSVWQAARLVVSK